MDDQGAFSPFAPLTISDIPFFGMSLSFMLIIPLALVNMLRVWRMSL